MKVGDRVIDRDGVSRKVLNTFCRPYKGEVFEVKACGLPAFRVTPEHPIFVAKADASRPGYKGAKRRFAPPAFVEARAVSKFDMLYVPRMTTVVDVLKTKFKGGPKTRNEPEVAIDDDLCAVAGFYLAEGGVRGDGRTVQFVFNKTEVAYADVVGRWAVANGFEYHVVFGVGTCVIYVYGKAAAVFFGDNFGCGSFNKRLPAWVMTLPQAKQLRILEHYFRGDACLPHEKRDNMTASSRSDTLIRQVQQVLTRCGFAASRNVVQDHGAPRYQLSVCGAEGVRLATLWSLSTPIKKHRFSHMRVTETHVLHPVKRVTALQYEGDVFNLEVETTNTYCVPCVVHNCEKDALAGVISPVAREYHVTLMVNRGYSSSSAMHEAAQRYLYACKETGKHPHLLYLGDMDPSGEDMVRDVSARLSMFGVENIEVRKVALTMPQVKHYAPPPNPAKMSDSRAKKYVEEHGKSSWEVDALPPPELGKLIRAELDQLVDRELMDKIMAQEDADKAYLRDVVSKNKELQ